MALAVIVCDGKDTMSVRVPDGFLELHRSFKIHSKQFVYETLIGWGLNPEKTYSFKGEYLEEQKMVVFSSEKYRLNVISNRNTILLELIVLKFY